jgi:hypothetical protein
MGDYGVVSIGMNADGRFSCQTDSISQCGVKKVRVTRVSTGLRRYLLWNEAAIADRYATTISPFYRLRRCHHSLNLKHVPS